MNLTDQTFAMYFWSGFSLINTESRHTKVRHKMINILLFNDHFKSGLPLQLAGIVNYTLTYKSGYFKYIYYYMQVLSDRALRARLA